MISIQNFCIQPKRGDCYVTIEAKMYYKKDLAVRYLTIIKDMTEADAEVLARKWEVDQLAVFKDEHEAESYTEFFVKTTNWRMCCAGGYYNAWCPREDNK